MSLAFDDFGELHFGEFAVMAIRQVLSRAGR